MQARIIELKSSGLDQEEAYIAYLEELATSPPDIDASNAQGIRMCVNGTGLGAERVAWYLRRILRDPGITVNLLERWMVGSSMPTMRQARMLYLIAKPVMREVSAHLSRLTVLTLLLSPLIQLPDLAGQLL